MKINETHLNETLRTIKEYAAEKGMTREGVWYQVRNGKLNHIRIRGHIFIVI